MSESCKIPQTVSLNPQASYTIPIVPNPTVSCPVGLLPHHQVAPPPPAFPLYHTGDIDMLVATFSVTVSRGTAVGNLCFVFFAGRKPIAIIELPIASGTTAIVTTQSDTFTTDKLACKDVLSVIVTSSAAADVGLATDVVLNSIGLTYCVSCGHRKH